MSARCRLVQQDSWGRSALDPSPFRARTVSLEMFRKVDCVLVRVPSLDAGLAFYRDKLGHRLVWRMGNESAGLALDDAETELVLRAEEGEPEFDLLVDSVETSAANFVAAGGAMVGAIEQIAVGKRATLRDPWGNHLPILDLSEGTLETDAASNVVGVRGRPAGESVR